MLVSVLSIGTELIRGEIVNTNATWLCQQLTELGATVDRVETVADDPAAIAATLKRLAQTSNAIVSTGGLGPTSDDLTADAVAELLAVELVTDKDSLRRIRERLERRGRPLSPSNAKQADLPAGATALVNEKGTAPGFSVRIGEAVGYFLQGVPREMKAIFERDVAPAVTPAGSTRGYQVHLRTFGLPESVVGDRLEDIEHEFDVVLGFRARFPEVEVKLHALGDSFDEAKGRAQAAGQEVRRRLGDDIVYGEGTLRLPDVVGDLLKSKNLSIAVAESCTGGLVNQLLTARAGASAFYKGGAVTYSNGAKMHVLGVDRVLLERHGAVSAQVARAMAEGVRERFRSSVSVAFTGIAGPTGGTADKPVGLVHYAVATPDNVVCEHHVFHGDRAQVQLRAAFTGLALVRRLIR